MRLSTRTPDQISNYHQLTRNMPNQDIYDNISYANLQISAYNGGPLNLESFTDSDLKYIFTHKDINGMTPFHYAWYNGHYKTALEIHNHLKLKNISLLPTHYDILSSTFFAIIDLANLSGIIVQYFTQKERTRIDFFNIGF
jgi:ankyrin repeat protein